MIYSYNTRTNRDNFCGTGDNGPTSTCTNQARYKFDDHRLAARVPNHRIRSAKLRWPHASRHVALHASNKHSLVTVSYVKILHICAHQLVNTDWGMPRLQYVWYSLLKQTPLNFLFIFPSYRWHVEEIATSRHGQQRVGNVGVSVDTKYNFTPIITKFSDPKFMCMLTEFELPKFVFIHVQVGRSTIVAK
jgi:hypothetical protein